MYAFVNLKGNQYKVEVGKFIYVPFMGMKENETFTIKNVSALQKDGDIQFGHPYLEGVSVDFSILEAAKKSDKVIVFKKKRRKGYRKKVGHRQTFSKVLVKNINSYGA